MISKGDSPRMRHCLEKKYKTIQYSSYYLYYKVSLLLEYGADVSGAIYWGGSGKGLFSTCEPITMQPTFSTVTNLIA